MPLIIRQLTRNASSLVTIRSDMGIDTEMWFCRP